MGRIGDQMQTSFLLCFATHAHENINGKHLIKLRTGSLTQLWIPTVKFSKGLGNG